MRENLVPVFYDLPEPTMPSQERNGEEKQNKNFEKKVKDMITNILGIDKEKVRNRSYEESIKQA